MKRESGCKNNNFHEKVINHKIKITFHILGTKTYNRINYLFKREVILDFILTHRRSALVWLLLEWSPL